MKSLTPGPWLEMVKGSVITLVLFLAYVSFPLLGMFPGLFVPLPGIYYAQKHGIKVGMAIVAISVAVLMPIAGVSSAILYLLQCGIMTLALPVFLSRGWGGARSIASAVALNVAVVALFAVVFALSQGIDLHGQVLKGINASITQTAALYEKSGLTGEELQTFKTAMEQAGALIGRIYPALVIITLATIAGLNLWIMTRLAIRLPGFHTLGEFSRFKNPDQLIWVVIAAGFSMLIPQTDVAGMALNVLIVTLLLYFVQGLAIIGWFFNRFTVPGLVRAIFYILLTLQPYLAVAVAALGIFDLWGDFRTPRQPENL
ncbi:YybS family protein [Geobacter sp. AOG1]|uniref:YybS family protein n=1 Tax=Geobacter sp. AOG1 TaxID=1566346 RepID=UPI001CC5B9F5|nr:YybS family protein [Geobacter sp. AOG1]GFE56379.1 membrane protein [Geobacter sp. AOG1]